MSDAIEVVLFAVKHGTPDTLLRTKALAVTPVLRMIPGFIDRKFGKSEDGKYIDIVYWTNLETAQKAAEQVMQIPVCLEYFSLIDESTMEMKHYTTYE
jgi:hypothetical protein